MKLALSLNYSDLFPKERKISEYFSRSVFCQSPREAWEFLEETPEKYIELVVPGEFPFPKEHLTKRIVEDYGLKFSGIHQPISRLSFLSDKEIVYLFKTAGYFRVDVLVIHLSAIGKRIFTKEFVKKIKKLEKKYKVKIAVENSTKDPITILKPYCYRPDVFGELMLKNNLGITFDTTHLAEAGGDILNFYEKYKKLILNIHLSDYGGSLFRLHQPIGKGNLPLKEFLRRLKKDKYGGIITFEVCGRNEEIKDSMEIVKKYS